MSQGHLSRHLDVPMTTVAHVQKFKGHRTDPRCDCKGVIDDKLKRRLVYGYPRRLPERLGVTAEVKAHQIATIRPHLRQSGLNGRGPMRTPQFKANHKKKKRKKKTRLEFILRSRTSCDTSQT